MSDEDMEAVGMELEDLSGGEIPLPAGEVYVPPDEAEGGFPGVPPLGGGQTGSGLRGGPRGRGAAGGRSVGSARRGAGRGRGGDTGLEREVGGILAGTSADAFWRQLLPDVNAMNTHMATIVAASRLAEAELQRMEEKRRVAEAALAAAQAAQAGIQLEQALADKERALAVYQAARQKTEDAKVGQCEGRACGLAEGGVARAIQRIWAIH